VKLAWTQEALEKLVEIEEYISKDSPARAEKFINQLIGRAESLSKNPNKGRIVPEFLIPELRELIFKNYRIAEADPQVGRLLSARSLGTKN
jgi:plasmid stabilization system protein ParE